MHIQTTDLELEVNSFPTQIWYSQSNSIPRPNSYIQTQHKRIQNSTQNVLLWTMVFGLANERGVYSFLNSSAISFGQRTSMCS